MFKSVKKKKPHAFDSTVADLRASVDGLQQINDVAERYEAIQEQIKMVNRGISGVEKVKGKINDNKRFKIMAGTALGGGFLGGCGLIGVGMSLAAPPVVIAGLGLTCCGALGPVTFGPVVDAVCDKIESRRHIKENGEILDVLKSFKIHLVGMKDALVEEHAYSMAKSKHAERLLDTYPELSPAFARALVRQPVRDDVVKVVKLPKPSPAS
ncbi:MAG: hypothetical protein OXT65_04840 [Alphaproteobacteria bacterium]|nr:hypothetical protein [Alphaproteobacteria bacterium]